MWAFRFGAVHIHSHIKQGNQSQLKKVILSETPCRSAGCRPLLMGIFGHLAAELVLMAKSIDEPSRTTQPNASKQHPVCLANWVPTSHRPCLDGSFILEGSHSSAFPVTLTLRRSAPSSPPPLPSKGCHGPVTRRPRNPSPGHVTRDAADSGSHVTLSPPDGGGHVTP